MTTKINKDLTLETNPKLGDCTLTYDSWDNFIAIDLDIDDVEILLDALTKFQEETKEFND